MSDRGVVQTDSSGRLVLTYEHALWALVGLLALGMRLSQLGDAPLAVEEAREALHAWRAASGQGIPLTNYNPVLLAANSLLFTLFGSSDALARFGPALSGVCLALMPFPLRRWLGRAGALASAFYLAVSPTALIASRRVDGTMVGAAAAMAFVGGAVRYLETERRGWILFSAVALGVGVAGGGAVYGVLVPLGVAGAAASRLGDADERPRLGRLVRRLADSAPQFLPTFAVAAAVAATGLGWNLAGLSASGDLLVDWLARFRGLPPSAASPLVLLAAYELLGVAFGLGGAALVVRRGRPFGMVLTLWAALAVVLLLVMPGRAPTDVLWAVLPLALLSGAAVEALVGDDWRAGLEVRAVHVAVALVLWAHTYLTLARYAVYGDPASLALALMAVVLQGFVVAAAAVAVGWRGSVRAAAAAVGVALLTLLLSAGWGVAYARPDDPREALLASPTARNVRDLVDTVERISWRETGMPTTLAFPYEAPADSVVAWYLRDFDQARRVGVLQDLRPQEIGDTAVAVGLEAVFPGNAERTYIGQDFALRRHWSPRSLDWRLWHAGGQAAVEWLLFRSGVSVPEGDAWVTLWRAGDVSYSE